MPPTETIPCRFCIVGPAHPFRGGIAHYTVCMAQALSTRGHSVKVINYRSLYPRFLFPGKTMLDNSADPLTFDAEQIIRPLAPWSWFKAASRLRAHRPGLVVFQWWHVFFAPVLLNLIMTCRRSGIPVAVVCHNVIDHDNHAPLNRIANRLLKATGATIIVHSRRDAEAMAAGRPSASVIRVQHPTYDTFAVGRPISQAEARVRINAPAGPLCLFFGLVRKYKGLQDLLQAFAQIPAAERPHLVVAGEFYEPVHHFHNMIRDLDIVSSVTVHNRYIPNEEVSHYFRAADLLIAPYSSAGQSGVVRIAQAFDLPAIVTDVGGLTDMVQSGVTGYVVPPGDPQALAAAVTQFFRSGEADAFSRNIAESKKEFSWDSLCEKLEGLAACASA